MKIAQLLDWDENDFLHCLEVQPVVEDDGLEFHYRVQKNGLALAVTVIPHCNSVIFSLSQEGNELPTLSFCLLVMGGVSYHKDKRGEHLRFSKCMIVNEPYSYYGEELEEAKNEKHTFNLTAELFIKPHIRIKFD